MKLALLTIIALAGLQFALAQNVTDCTDIAAGLETIAIDPITGEHLNMLWIELHVAIILISMGMEVYCYWIECQALILALELQAMTQKCSVIHPG